MTMGGTVAFAAGRAGRWVAAGEAGVERDGDAAIQAHTQTWIAASLTLLAKDDGVRRG
jgi:hypothetical protein